MLRYTVIMEKYIQNIIVKYKDSQTSEMGYRTDFENLLLEFFPKEQKYFIHHDARSVGGNKPDFVILKNQTPLLYIENKDIGIDLNKIEKGSQMERYFGYENLILTDYLEFRFYRNGEPYGEKISIGTYDKNSRTIYPISENYDLLKKTLLDFTFSHKEPIKRGKHLAQIMGGKAQRIRDNVKEMLSSDHSSFADIQKMKQVVQESLIHGLEDDSFADMYSQTLVYGLFAARYNDTTSKDFSRLEARELVPKTNPFLRAFFDHIAGNTFPERLRFIVDELCEVFSHADVKKLLTDFYKTEKENKDPVIHFYEDFLKEYDPKKKMEMGVFYTPQPVVRFIVRAVDDILKKEFAISKGLSDTTKIKVKKKEIYQAKKATKAEQAKDGKEVEVEKEYHKVQILDIATGTGTFLNEVINHIYRSFEGQQGRWSSYVKDDLLPRLHGFELMMASYTIAHLKLGMTLQDFGAKDLNERLGVYLTNTLEEPVNYLNQNTLFGIMDSIADEAKNASRVKSEYPIMCVIGNPPYSGESMNPEYTDNNVYKVEPGGLSKLKERNPKWINDDYVKFIRFAESLIEKNGEGIVGMITAHGYIDNPTFRGMRWHLRKTFDKIYVLDLHGNSRKKETAPDGSKDENVFDIMTGVSIILGIKNNTKTSELADIYKADLYGIREEKFIELEKSIEDIQWIQLPTEIESWTLEGAGKKEYMKGFSVTEMFPLNSVGIVTARDSLAIQYTADDMLDVLNDFGTLPAEEARAKYGLGKDARDWTVIGAQRDIINTGIDKSRITKISYRPFDTRYTYYTGNSRGFQCMARARARASGHLFGKNNVALIFVKQVKAGDRYHYVNLTDTIVESSFISNKTGEINYFAPLYLYTGDNEKVPNLNREIWNKINETAGETTPENILDYIYAVLHSPTYRDKYKEFLKIDFPRVPYPENKDTFWKLVKLGEKLRGLHLMTDSDISNLITTFPEPGTDEVDKISYKNNNVYINERQYFGGVPEVCWDFYIGGYQPAQKWLKDRKGRKLSNEDIEHYQKIIKILSETNKIMEKIGEIWIE